MSIWDRVKPAARVPAAIAVDVSADKRRLTLRWDDGAVTAATAQALRQGCPCAECVDEWSGQRTLDVAAVPEALAFAEVAPVGNYALTFTFGDGHRTGIFPWATLRQLTAPV